MNRTLQGAIATIASILFLSLVIALTINIIAVHTLDAKLEVFVTKNNERDSEQQFNLMALNIKDYFQRIDNTKTLKRLEANLEAINWLTTRVVNNSIEIDQYSLEGINIVISEIEDDIKRLEKRLK